MLNVSSFRGTGKVSSHLTCDGSCHIGVLYQFSDKTGVFSTHEQRLAQLYEDREVDIKMMYYELIRMMIAHERDKSCMTLPSQWLK